MTLQHDPKSDPTEYEFDLSVVIPCLNEADTLESCILDARSFLGRSSLHAEIVVADNGSTDRSPEIAREAGARVVEVAERGYGHAIRTGVEAARGRWVIMGDADRSYDLSALGPFIAQLENGYDLVMGNRYRGGISEGAMPLLNRYLGTPTISFLGRLFYRVPVGDFNCGIRGFRRDAIRALNLNSGGMELASEMVIKAGLKGLSITEVPATLAPDERDREPHLQPWRDGWRHLRTLLLLCPRWLFFYPGLMLFTLGLVMMFWLVPSSRTIGDVTLDVNTLTYAGAAVAAGFQAMAYWTFARLIAVRKDLVPPDDWIVQMLRGIRLEVGLLAGAILFLGGLIGGVVGVSAWGQQAFGPLDPQASLRLTIPSATALVLGVQLLFHSFFLRVLTQE